MKALLFGINICKEKGYWFVEIDFDSQILVDIIQDKCSSPQSLASHISVIGCLILQAHFRIAHFFCKANIVLGILVNWGHGNGNTIFHDFATLPNSIRGALNLDTICIP